MLRTRVRLWLRALDPRKLPIAAFGVVSLYREITPRARAVPAAFGHNRPYRVVADSGHSMALSPEAVTRAALNQSCR